MANAKNRKRNFTAGSAEPKAALGGVGGGGIAAPLQLDGATPLALGGTAGFFGATDLTACFWAGFSPEGHGAHQNQNDGG